MGWHPAAQLLDVKDSNIFSNDTMNVWTVFIFFVFFLNSGQRSNVHILVGGIPGKCSLLYSAHAERNVNDGLRAAVKLFS